MPHIRYNFHDLIRVDIRGVSRYALKDLNCKFHYFEDTSSRRAADIEIEIGSFKPDLAKTQVVDQRYFVKDDYLFFHESDKGLHWQTEIQGLNGGPTKIRYAASPWNRLRWPWTFFPDYVLHHYVLQPLLERKFLDQNSFLFHAGGVVRNGEAVLFAGRGETYKTSIVLGLLKQGYELLGDDFVLIQGKTVLGFPTSPRFLEFTARKLKDERLDFRDQIRLSAYLLKSGKTSLPFVRSGELARVFLLLAYDGEELKPAVHLKSLSHLQAEEMLLTNQLLEHTSYVAYRYRVGQFLDVYDFIFPRSHDGCFEARLSDRIRASFLGVPMEALAIPRDFQPSMMKEIIARLDAQSEKI